MIQIALAAFSDLKRCLTQLVVYEVFFKLINIAFLIPFSAWILARFIATSGNVAVSNYEILSFLTSPIGILGIVIIATIQVFMLFAEQAGLIVIAGDTLSGHLPHAVGALWHTLRRLPHLLGLAFVQVVVYLLVLLPFLVILGITYTTLLSDHDINYYLTERPPEFWKAVVIGIVTIGGLIIVAGSLFIRFSLAVPACIIGGQRPVPAIRTSFRLLKGFFWRAALILATWLALLTGLGLLLSVPINLIEKLSLAIAGEKLSILIPTIAGLVILNVLTVITLSFIGLTSFCLLITRLFYHTGSKKEEPFSLAMTVATAGAAPFKAAWFTKKRVVLLAAFLFLAITTGLASFLTKGIHTEYRVAVTAHRAGTRNAPENTLSALRDSIAIRADFAEIDAQETADGVVVVLHDEDLMRIAGVDKKIWDITYQELKNLDVGSWFSAKFADERIPRLQEMIEAARDHIKLNIELKFNGHDKRLAERVAEIVGEEEFESQCVVSSLNYEGLMKAKQENDALKLGFVVFESVGDISKLDVDFLSINAERVTRHLVGTVHRHHKEVHVWTVNDPKKMSSLIDLRVDNIITDDPATLVAMLKERSELSDAERLLLAFRNWLGR